MAVLEIFKYPAPILKRPAKPVEEINPELLQLIDDMIETMYAAPGVGLAAPQVGQSCRVIVFDANRNESERSPMALINPEIIAAEGEFCMEEGCLSAPELNVEIKRKGQVRVKALTRDGKEVTIEAKEFPAVLLQHEIDHLDGKLIIDYLSGLKRSLYKRKLKRKEEKEKS
ncbi:MAG: peptide deformylase [Deltaproteobacteria bacterium]|nr:peptide deformylase [Deltaproteobacteria bacterium]